MLHLITIIMIINIIIIIIVCLRLTLFILTDIPPAFWFIYQLSNFILCYIYVSRRAS